MSMVTESKAVLGSSLSCFDDMVIINRSIHQESKGTPPCSPTNVVRQSLFLMKQMPSKWTKEGFSQLEKFGI